MTAVMRDPNPIHYDAETVRVLRLGNRTVNQGPPLNRAYTITALAEWAGGTDRVRRLRVRHEGTVFAGDRLRACGEVTGIDTARDADVPALLRGHYLKWIYSTLYFWKSKFDIVLSNYNVRTCQKKKSASINISIIH